MQQSHPFKRQFANTRNGSPKKQQQPKFKIQKAIGMCQKSENTVVKGRQQINRYVEISTWRSKTSLPILKVEQLNVYLQGESLAPESIFTFRFSINNSPSKNPQNKQIAQQLQQFTNTQPSNSIYGVTVKLEHVEVRLNEIQVLSFPQTIHLLKQILVGYEVLIDIFGFFVPTDKMIGVNSYHQWKIWINQDFKLNMSHSANITAKEFILKLVSIAELHSMKTSHAKQFFSYIYHEIDQKNCSFIHTLEKINQFARINKILHVSMVTLPRNQQNKNSPSKQIRLKTDHSNVNDSPSKSYTGRPKTPDLMVCHDSPTRHHPKIKKLQSKDSNFSQLAKGYNNCTLSKAEVHKKMIAIKQNWVKSRPYSNLTQEGKDSPKKQYFDKNFQSTQFPQTSHSFRLNNKEKPYYFSPRTTTNPNDRDSPTKKIMALNIINIKSTDNIIAPQSLPNLPQDLADNQISITFSRKNSIKLENDSLSSKKLQSPNKPNSRTSWFSIACQSPNHSSSTKQLRNSSEMQPEISSYAKLKEKDLKQKIRNNHSVINNGWKMEEQKQEEQHQQKKNLTVSHQFHNRYTHNLGRKNEGKGQDQWISTITGLFDDTKSIKHLKQSVKFKGKDDQVFQKQHLKNVKLDLLEKFGRKVQHMVDDDYPAPRKRKYTQNMESMQLIEEEGDDIKSYLETQRRDDDALSKVTHERNSRGLGPYLSPLIVYKDSKSEYDGEVSEESYVLPREQKSNIVRKTTKLV